MTSSVPETVESAPAPPGPSDSERRPLVVWKVFVALALPLGLLVVFVMPPWSGYDESAHFARSVDIASGNISPGSSRECPAGSALSVTHRADQDRVITNYLDRRAPMNLDLVGDLLGRRPSEETYCVDTMPTTASTPVGYLPSAIGMALPQALDAPGLVVLWAGRLADLVTYVGIVAAAIAAASSFRWTFAVAGLFPLNLALAASVTPDGLTLAALIATLAVFTRVHDGVTPPTRAVLEVAAAGSLLALAKPPYFLVLALFPVLLAQRVDTTRLRVAAVAVVLVIGGLIIGVANSDQNYRPVEKSITDTITYQPEIQRDRLLGDPIGFVGRVAETAVTEFPHYVSAWTRQLGFIDSQYSVVTAWLMLAVAVLATLRLDADSYQRYRGVVRGAFAAGAVAFVVLLYGTAYVYFDDSVEGTRIGRQMGRYSLALFPIVAIGLWPRAVLRGDRLQRLVPTRLVLVALAGTITLAFGSALLTWAWFSSGAMLD